MAETVEPNNSSPCAAKSEEVGNSSVGPLGKEDTESNAASKREANSEEGTENGAADIAKGSAEDISKENTNDNTEDNTENIEDNTENIEDNTESIDDNITEDATKNTKDEDDPMNDEPNESIAPVKTEAESEVPKDGAEAVPFLGVKPGDPNPQETPAPGQAGPAGVPPQVAAAFPPPIQAYPVGYPPSPWPAAHPPAGAGYPQVLYYGWYGYGYPYYHPYPYPTAPRPPVPTGSPVPIQPDPRTMTPEQKKDHKARQKELERQHRRAVVASVAHQLQANPLTHGNNHTNRDMYPKSLRVKETKWDKTWSMRLLEFRDFVLQNGHSRVPVHYPPNPKLGRWAMTQRRQYRLLRLGEKSSLTLTHVQRLRSAGFDFKQEDDKMPDMAKLIASAKRT